MVSPYCWKNKFHPNRFLPAMILISRVCLIMTGCHCPFWLWRLAIKQVAINWGREKVVGSKNLLVTDSSFMHEVSFLEYRSRIGHEEHGTNTY